MECLHKENKSAGECKGDLTVVENFTTGHRFTMCEKHADWYYDKQQEIINRYPEILNGGEDDY